MYVCMTHRFTNIVTPVLVIYLSVCNLHGDYVERTQIKTNQASTWKKTSNDKSKDDFLVKKSKIVRHF